MLTTAIRGNSL